MTGIPLQKGIIYGPILSRRLGRSLGINLLGDTSKVCSLNCIYCQYGHEKPLDIIKDKAIFPTTEDIMFQVDKALRKPRTIDYLTFSGNGEPTMYPDFVEIVGNVKALRDQLKPEANFAILTNATGVTDPDIFDALKLFDVSMMKLDAGDEKTFKRINRPAPGVMFSEIVEGLRKMPNLIIQSLMLDGRTSNVSGEPFAAWVHLMKELKPLEIHIYSISRPTAEEGLLPVSQTILQEIATNLAIHHNLPVKVF